MPHYEFFCHACKKKFSKILTVAEHEKEKIVCSHCGSKSVEQGWSAFQEKRLNARLRSATPASESALLRPLDDPSVEDENASRREVRS